MSPEALYRLMTWLSPGFPVGAYSHSSGLEWAVEENLVNSRVALTGWVRQLVTAGALRTDAVLLAHSYCSATKGNRDRLMGVAELAAAMHPGHERRFESTAQGAAFRQIARAVAPCPELDMLDEVEDEALCYPIVAGVLAAGHRIPLRCMLTAYLHACATNVVSAGQRLIPLGQTEAQMVIRDVEQSICAVADWASTLMHADPVEALGSSTLLADLASLGHETQQTRLFRT